MCLESPPQRFFTLIASNSRVTLIEVKNTLKTLKSPREKKRTVIQPEDFNELGKQVAGSVLRNGCSEKFEKISRKTSVVVCSFLILLTKTLHQRCFLCNFLICFGTTHDGCFRNYPV